VIQIKATLSQFRTLVDKTLKFTVHTQELPPETKAALFNMEQQIGWLVFSPQAIKPEEIPDEPIPPDGMVVKSPSSRLRAVIAVYLKKYGEMSGKTITQTQINHYYEQQVEKLIDEFKRKINDLN
jgi:alpha/beta superfamily hydrolase